MNLSPIIQAINFFGKTKIIEIAQSTGLVKRQRKLSSDTILKVFTFGLLNGADPSLKQITSKCKSVQPNLRITKQVIYKRLNRISAFLKEIFSLAIQFSIRNAVVVETSEILTQFEYVKIYDSTRISLPDKLAKVWPGLGGRNAKSSLKIQASYSLLSKSINNIELTKSPGTDTSYTEQIIAQTKEKELIITDLGYFSQNFLRSIVDQQAYFLTRIRKNTIIGTKKDGSNQSK